MRRSPGRSLVSGAARRLPGQGVTRLARDAPWRLRSEDAQRADGRGAAAERKIPYPQPGPAKGRRRKEVMNIKDTIAGRDLEALRAAIAGQVSVPGQAGYDQARRAWNLAVDERPAVVVVAESGSDVVEAVRFARGHGMRIAPQ